MNLAPILDLLRQRAGLDPASLGAQSVRSAVTERLRCLGATSVSEYSHRLAADTVEFSALLDEVVVPETWFLRGGELFTHLAEHVRATLDQRGPGADFRVLSVPCSTGEEPFSLAIALAEIGVPVGRCFIDGIDVSSRAIEQARRGTFSGMSFRQMEQQLRDRYFTPIEGGWEIAPEIHQAVRFQTGNVLDAALLRDEKPYDLVFCRNLFIYLHAAARQLALTNLERLLAPAGLLCLGHAESINPEDCRFERASPEGYFLYRRRNPIAPAGRSLAGITSPQTAQRSRIRENAGAESPHFGECGYGDPAPAPPPEGQAELLARTRQRADGGQLAEALALCQSIQERFGPSAELCSLIGIIHQARHERSEAMESFRKALYLEPEHEEALTHLMLLCQELGEHDQADRLRRRLQRLADREQGDR
jgi:chemotaxis protein methyltransferase WspC